MTAPGTSAQEPLVELHDVVRRFGSGDRAVDALRGVDLTVPRGAMVALHGRSGSGKTTLLNVVGGLDVPTGGSVRVCGLDLVAASRGERVLLRRDRVAFVFQAFGLLPVLTAAENVEVPLRLRRLAPAARRARVAELLDLVGLGQRAAHRPGELSGGEQQRVAIARALANEPDLLVADEPTGQLDSGTGRRIMDLLRHLVDESGLSIVVATHDPTLLDVADVALELLDGRLAAGDYAQRFDGDVDRSRVLSESVTLPRAVGDPDAAWRPPDGVDGGTVVLEGDATAMGAVPDADRVGARPLDDAPDVPDAAVQRPRPRWGPDGEVLED
jgi:putative ABC transport system ATP-binding protein